MRPADRQKEGERDRKRGGGARERESDRERGGQREAERDRKRETIMKSGRRIASKGILSTCEYA